MKTLNVFWRTVVVEAGRDFSLDARDEEEKLQWMILIGYAIKASLLLYILIYKKIFYIRSKIKSACDLPLFLQCHQLLAM
jgi:hypothetical protein